MENYKEQKMNVNPYSKTLDVMTAVVFGAVITLGLVYMVRMLFLLSK